MPDEKDLTKKPDLGDVIRALASGSDVNWVDMDGAPEDSTRAVLSNLEIVSRIAAVHGTLDESPSDPPLGLPPSIRSWGPLTILERVGTGSYGDVYRAWDTRLDREVALKLLYDDATATAGSAVVEEARLLARVRHPNVVTVYGADRIDGRVGIWMEFLDGRTLEQLLQEQGPFAPGEAAQIGVEVCRGLTAVHRSGLVHGDVKANNVMRDDAGRVALMDFGTSGHIHHPRPGQVAGTPLYIAPELLDGSPSTPRADVYSVGVLLYHLVSGAYPVTGRTLSDVREAHRQRQRRPLLDVKPGLPRRFVDIVERAIDPDPGRRFEAAAAFETALAEVLAPEDAAPPAPRRRRKILTATLAAMAVVGVAAMVAIGSRSADSAQARLGFEPRDSVLITRFDNRTGESVFDGAVELALQRALSESDVVGLVPDERVGDALLMMKRPSDTVVDRTVGREVALRDGHVKALLAGRIEKFGSNYVVTAQLIDPADDAVVETIREQANGQTATVAALQRVSSQVRVALGENRNRIRGADPNIEPASTSSLQALQLYNESFQLGLQNNWAAAREIAQQMVVVDPEFASGWIWLAWTVRNTENPRDNAALVAKYREFAEQALKLGEQVPEWERNWITGSYYTLTLDHARSIPYYDALLRLRPEHFYALNNVTNARFRLHRQEDYAEHLILLQKRGDQRPNVLNALAQAARAAVQQTGTVQKSQPYLDRLQILAQSSEPLGARARFEHDFASAYVRLYAGDLQGTLDQIHRITQVFETYPEDLRTDTLTGISSYYAALGRRADVVRFARALKNPLDRETMRRSLADGAELRKIMEAYPPERPPNQYWNGVSYVRAGLAQMAWRYINNRESRSYNEGYALIARGQLRLLDGDARRALEDLQQGVKLTEPMNHPAYFSGCESLGDVLWKLERKYDAIDALERCSRNYFKGIAVWAPLGEVRASLDLHLADFYRGIGQVPRAQEIERRLRSRLALADHDFPLLKELRSRN